MLNIEQWVNESKAYGGDSPDFESWSDDKVKKWWATFKKNHETWDDKVKALKGKGIKNPEGFIATMQKRATGKWSGEKGANESLVGEGKVFPKDISIADIGKWLKGLDGFSVQMMVGDVVMSAIGNPDNINVRRDGINLNHKSGNKYAQFFIPSKDQMTLFLVGKKVQHETDLVNAYQLVINYKDGRRIRITNNKL